MYVAPPELGCHYLLPRNKQQHVSPINLSVRLTICVSTLKKVIRPTPAVCSLDAEPDDHREQFVVCWGAVGCKDSSRPESWGFPCSQCLLTLTLLMQASQVSYCSLYLCPERMSLLRSQCLMPLMLWRHAQTGLLCCCICESVLASSLIIHSCRMV